MQDPFIPEVDSINDSNQSSCIGHSKIYLSIILSLGERGSVLPGVLVRFTLSTVVHVGYNNFHHHSSSQLPSTDDRDGKTIIMLYVLFNVLYMNGTWTCLEFLL